jgi:hypothetical protein
MRTLADTINPPIDLREFDDDFARAESRPPAAEPGLEEIPDGIYETQVEDVTLNRTSNTGNPMIIWKLRIQGPHCQGRTLSKVRVITPKTIPFVKEDLDRLDIQLERLSEIYSHIDDMINRPVRVFKKTNTERRWTDVYFLRARKGPQSEGSTEDAWRTGTTDDLPF